MVIGFYSLSSIREKEGVVIILKYITDNNRIRMKEEIKEVKPNKSKSYTIDAVLVRSPLKFLSDAIAQKRFLEGVIVSVMYFERFGLRRIKEYFESKSIPLKPMEIENLRLSTILLMLKGFQIISPKIHDLMGEVCKERNHIVHKMQHPDAIEETKARKTIEKAIECLKALGAT